ncbi:R3H domain-containing nucleic acid-binding protein [Macrococcoides bohemicum]|nr:R3H domain-containing nucleic acid-binding protein [Macrococcus bohemicus]
MPNYERKIMHQILTNIENIETYSEGREPHRYLVIKAR